ncbi:hypothetical protein [Staphylothermus hellenicus]|uniref:Uncharacterized protein n=1 Tax=Staphylothermus hellenicus (strain DSM 12710 / JCM 10830 / BK20S6-10-b1 / P8) TaxID=591019 RepID=D7D9R2_STAHD|nr:hypothetical protein [Staphylothermus hellenicus]ADI32508.1 hypothetical protein Shell_1420 [Staphylothermus hellenicus DSM 12710]
MVYITLSILTGLFFSLLGAFLTYLISRRRFFQEAFTIVEKYNVPSRPRDKGELRRLKKFKRRVSMARKRLVLLFFSHLTVFMITYISTIIAVSIIVPSDELIVSIPIAIPLLSAKENDLYVTNILFIAFIAYLAPLYTFIRAVRPVSE